MQVDRVSYEVRQNILPLTKALYRVSERFPEREPLRRRIREYADEILAGVVEWNLDAQAGELAGKIDTLRDYLLIAAHMQWVSSINIEVLARGYTMLCDDIQKERLWEPKRRRQETEAILGDLDIPEKNESTPVKKEDFSHEFDNAKITIEIPRYEPNERQRTILQHLTLAKQAKVSDFFSLLGPISSKTIQRDLTELVNKNVLRKEGQKRWTVYSLNDIS
ncbi:MAG: hypothetical protein HY221_02540 [Candidatus Sungbacteria bacterium]|uniref:HTH deoR-type domain-containing protein n=1 Tax=Candidatus Sungiibacteriota bacterium TaxID=2750080 RepID=A0A932R223_9BACT|nr:hypothetical protein [Candidatus Sungbacteria bacterium]